MNTCDCGGKMEPSKAIQNTLTGIPDFIGSKEVVTVSYGGKGKLIDCLKCKACGKCVTK